MRTIASTGWDDFLKSYAASNAVEVVRVLLHSCLHFFHLWRNVGLVLIDLVAQHFFAPSSSKVEAPLFSVRQDLRLSTSRTGFVSHIPELLFVLFVLVLNLRSLLIYFHVRCWQCDGKRHGSFKPSEVTRIGRLRAENNSRTRGVDVPHKP